MDRKKGKEKNHRRRERSAEARKREKERETQEEGETCSAESVKADRPTVAETRKRRKKGEESGMEKVSSNSE